MTHADAWTGQPIEGKAYVLATTEGPELVAVETFESLAGAADEISTVALDQEVTRARLDALEATVKRLDETLRALTVDAPTEPAPEPGPEAPATTTRKAAAK